MKIGMIYSGVPGHSGADYMTYQLKNAFTKHLKIKPVMVGHPGISGIAGEGEKGFDINDIQWDHKVDFYIHVSGYNLTPDIVNRIQDNAPLFLWTQNDEMEMWQRIMEPITEMVAAHYSYTKEQTYGDHVKYMPICADDTSFYPLEEKPNKFFDIAMIGAPWGVRKHFAAQLIQKYKCFFYFGMDMSFEDINWVYNSTKIVIAPMMDCDKGRPGSAWGCPCRTFEVPASGAFHLQVKRGGLSEVYPLANTVEPNADINWYLDSWIENIDYYLSEPEGREILVRRDYEYTVKNHLYKHRAKQMIDDFKGGQINGKARAETKADKNS